MSYIIVFIFRLLAKAVRSSNLHDCIQRIAVGKGGLCLSQNDEQHVQCISRKSQPNLLSPYPYPYFASERLLQEDVSHHQNPISAPYTMAHILSMLSDR